MENAYDSWHSQRSLLQQNIPSYFIAMHCLGSHPSGQQHPLRRGFIFPLNQPIFSTFLPVLRDPYSRVFLHVRDHLTQNHAFCMAVP